MAAPDPAPEFEFDLGGLDQKPAKPVVHMAAPRQKSGIFAGIGLALQRLKARGGLFGAIASVAILIAKFAGLFNVLLLLLIKIPFLVTIGTMAISIWIEARSFGWPLAVGIVAMIFIHECGHAWAARRLGRPVTGMVFVPFVGAAVFTRAGGTTLTQDAFVGIMGPIFGTAVGLVYVALFFVTRLPVFLKLAAWTFGINLFNLFPMPPLDGGWIMPVVSPEFVREFVPWKPSPASNTHPLPTKRDGLVYGLLYAGLAALLLTAMLSSQAGFHAIVRNV